MTAAKTTGPRAASIDVDEVAYFSSLASTWWDPNGPFKPLHKLNPTRLHFIREQLEAHFGLKGKKDQPLESLELLDIGCGGGLLCEPMARLGANVTGIDASEKNIKVASLHAKKSGFNINYKAIAGEELAKTKSKFDIILNMEVLEHVADVASFLGACRELINPSGIMLFSTINRTPKSYLFAIVGAEYVLNWLPKGTHHWDKFLKPSEMDKYCRAAGFELTDLYGFVFDPLNNAWGIKKDCSVNYIGVALPAK